MKEPELKTAPGTETAPEQNTVKEKEGNYYVYLLLCSDGSYYCGYTDDPERRLAAHNSGKGAKYTRSRRPCRLVYTEQFGSKHEAMRREYFLKKLNHREREQLVRQAECRPGKPLPGLAGTAGRKGERGAENGGSEHSLRGR